MSFTTAPSESAHPGLLGRAFDWIRTRARRDAELAALSRADLHLMANDLGITEADLIDVLPRATDHTLLMDRMMEVRGLDPQKVRGSLAPLVRELELVCTRCRAAARCRRELDAGTAQEHCHEYCGNAETFDDLLQMEATNRQ